MLLFYFILMMIGPSVIHCVTCDEVLDLPPETTISLQDLKTMIPKDTVQCLPHLGRKTLQMREADYIWQTVIKFYGGVPSIPYYILAHLHWVTVALRPEDYANITIGTIEVVKNFGLDYGLDLTLLGVIADRVREDFSDKVPEDYTYYDLKALNQILCAFNRSEIERIHPSAYKEAALFIGRLKRCNSEIMRGFATLAEHKDAFGPSKDWTGLILKTVGKVAEYLPGGISNISKNKEIEDEKVDEPEIPDTNFETKIVIETYIDVNQH